MQGARATYFELRWSNYPWRQSGGRQQMSDSNREEEWGGEYGPYIMSRYTTELEGHCRIHYTVSAWNPYQVMVMRSDLKLESRPKK